MKISEEKGNIFVYQLTIYKQRVPLKLTEHVQHDLDIAHG